MGRNSRLQSPELDGIVVCGPGVRGDTVPLLALKFAAAISFLANQKFRFDCLMVDTLDLLIRWHGVIIVHFGKNNSNDTYLLNLSLSSWGLDL